MAKVATALDLEDLAALSDKATTGPWYVGSFDDEHFMSAISIEAYLPNEERGKGCEVIAATLIQQPNYVVPSDRKWEENARLIVEMRNALPELLRLSGIGRATEQGG